MFVALNLFAPPFLSYIRNALHLRWYYVEWIDVIVVILLVAQIELISFLTVFSTSIRILRWPCGLLLVSFTVANGRALAVGGKLPASSPGTVKLTVVGVCLTTTVFLVFKWFIRLSVAPPSDGTAERRSRYDMTELISCVSLIALAMLVFRSTLMIKPELVNPRLMLSSEFSEIPGADFFFVSFFACTLVYALPCIFGGFRPIKITLISAWLLITIPFSIAEIFLLQSLGEWINWPSSFFVMYAVNLLPSIVFVVALRKFQASGFELKRQRK